LSIIAYEGIKQARSKIVFKMYFFLIEGNGLLNLGGVAGISNFYSNMDTYLFAWKFHLG
jgi:hypothetical protein